MRRRRWPALLPVLVLGALAAGLVSEVEQRLDAPEQATLRASLSGAAAPVAAATGDIADAALNGAGPRVHLAETAIERNLFAVDRRAPRREDAERAPVVSQPRQAREAPPLEARLTGVVLAGERSIAVLEEADGGRVLRLRPGERVQGWELVELTVLGARLRSGEYERMLHVGFGDREREAPEGTDLATPRQALDDATPGPQPPRAAFPQFSFPSYESGTVESMQGHAGGGLRPARGGAGGNVRDGVMAPPAGN